MHHLIYKTLRKKDPGALGPGCQGFTLFSIIAFSEQLCASIFLHLLQSLPFFQIIGLNLSKLNIGSITG